MKRKMRIRIWSLVITMIAVAMILGTGKDVHAEETTYLTIGGVAMTDRNLVIDSEDIPGVAGSATYDPANNTLTLDGFVSNYAWKNMDAYIRSEDGLTLVLKGTNQLINSGGVLSVCIMIGSDLSITGNGSLNVDLGSGPVNRYGLMCWGQLTINDHVNLTISCGECANADADTEGIAMRALGATIEDYATVHAIGGNLHGYGYSYGMEADHVEIGGNAKVTLEGDCSTKSIGLRLKEYTSELETILEVRDNATLYAYTGTEVSNLGYAIEGRVRMIDGRLFAMCRCQNGFGILANEYCYVGKYAKLTAAGSRGAVIANIICVNQGYGWDDEKGSGVPKFISPSDSVQHLDYLMMVIGHHHEFKYTLSEDKTTITQKCIDSPNPCDRTKNPTLTITAPADRPYNGKPLTASLTLDDEQGVFSDAEIRYFRNGKEISGEPVEVGEYTASVTVENVTASVTFKITAGTLVLTEKQKPTAVKGLHYIGRRQRLIEPPADPLPGGYTMYYAIGTEKDKAPESGAYTTELPTKVAEGTYYVWFYAKWLADRPQSEPAYIKVSIGKQWYANEWIKGKWYNKDGSQTYKPVGSWHKDKKGWWFGDTSGWYAKNGWRRIDTHWYYFNAQGYMETDCYRYGWYLKKDGAWDENPTSIGWKQSSKGWTYLIYFNNPLRKQWAMINGKYYYFKATGYAAQGEFVEGWWLDKTTGQQVGTKSTWHKDKKGWWYGDASGWYAKNASYIIDGMKYKFNSKGYLVN